MADPRSLREDIDRYVSGDDVAGDAICARLEPAARAALRRHLSEDDPDADDLAQESMLAFLRYLRKAGQVPVNPEAFLTTIVRNRCTNLHLWRRRRRAEDVHELGDTLAHPGSSPLDALETSQRHALLQEALDALDGACRDLLVAVYRQDASMEELRKSLGLGSVQAVYYRRDACLRKAQKFLNRRLFGGRSLVKTTEAPRTVPTLEKSGDGRAG